jgi:aminoglycoside 6'-N-acetyltransferase I
MASNLRATHPTKRLRTYYSQPYGDLKSPASAGLRSQRTGEVARVALAREFTPEHLQEVDVFLRNGTSGNLPAAILVAHDEKDALLGFLEVGLRSHADGCDPAWPVGFVEGWFVGEKFRNQGVGRELMRSAEDWARAHGAREMASDALINNDRSQRAHAALGFEVVDRCMHFRKAL